MFEEYIRRSSEISKLNLFPDESMSDSEFISHLYKTSARIQSLCQANQRQLSEEIEPLFKNPESLTEEQQKEIESFAQALTKTSGCDDIYISQKAYEVLLYCARKQGNVGRIIKQLYNCGITYYQWMREKQLSLADEGIKTSYKNRFFFDMEAYMAKWKETVFDAETMDYLIRGYANRLLGFTTNDSYEQMIRLGQETLHVLDDPELAVRFPALPYTRYRIAIHQNILTAISALREGKGGEWTIEQLAVSTAFLDRYLPERTSQYADHYRHHAGLYHIGKETADQMVEALISLYENVAPNDFSQEGIWGNIRIPTYIMTYVSDTTFSAEKKEQITRNVEQKFFDYCLKFNSSSTETYFLNSTCQSIHTILDNCQDASDKLLVDLIMKRHTPTYIHSVMVARLSAFLSRVLYRKAPSRLKALEDSCGGTDKMFNFIYRAGLFHDIGKVLCIKTVGIYNRKLFPEEFSVVEKHSLSGYLILNSNHKTSRYAQSALMHHFWYDRSRGYPQLPDDFVEDSVLDVVTDIITVADSLDAATDTVGRSYSPGISLEKLTNEMRAGRNTRYAGYLVDLLDDERVYKRLDFLLGEGRILLYQRNYRRVQQEKDMSSSEIKR